LFSPPRRARHAKARHGSPGRAETRHSRTAEAPASERQPAASPRRPDERAPARADGPAPAKSVSARPPARAAAIPEPPRRPAEAPPRRQRTATLTPEGKATIAPHRPAAERQPEPKHATRPPAGDGPAAHEPVPEAAKPESPPPPSACQLRLTPDLAAVKLLPPISSGQCTAEDVVSLQAVMAKDGRRVTVVPPATLRCPMAESVIHWIRDEVASVATGLGAQLKSVSVDTSYECRPRNHVAGAKLSEHGHANAVDVDGFTLSNGAVIRLTDLHANRQAREHLRETACARFTTVLGPGSDGYHESHIHLDLIERRSGYRICQWDVRDPATIAAVPLPPERPAAAPPRGARTIKSGARD